MKNNLFKILSVGILVIVVVACSKKIITTQTLPIETGVSKALADHRKAVISNLGYTLHLTIPEGKTTPILGQETIYFKLKNNNAPLQIDFKEKTDHFQEVTVKGQIVTMNNKNEKLVIPSQS